MGNRARKERKAAGIPFVPPVKVPTPAYARKSKHHRRQYVEATLERLQREKARRDAEQSDGGE